MYMNFFQKVIEKIYRDVFSEKIERATLTQGLEIMDMRCDLKKLNEEKIRVVFICHRPALWSLLQPVFDACNSDDMFEPIIMAIPNKKELPKLGLSHEEYISEGAEEFFSDFPCQVIEGYNYNTHSWYDLRSLRPDYVFFQTPYDICRPPEYKSEIVSLYAKLCYIPYGFTFMNGYILEQCTPVNYIKHTYFSFVEHKEMQEYIRERAIENPIHKKERVLLTGYPKFDYSQKFVGCESTSWKLKGERKRYRVIWTPRWCMDEDNCTFFKFKDFMLEYAENNTEIELLFRPHPQAFKEFLAKGLMTEKEVDLYVSKFNANKNTSVDANVEYLQTFYSSDLLVTDESSIIPEYFLTGKPIILTYKKTHFTNFAQDLSKGFYWAKNMNELKNHIERLVHGEDPLKETREALKNELFNFSKEGAGFQIKEFLKEDYLGKKDCDFGND